MIMEKLELQDSFQKEMIELFCIYEYSNKCFTIYKDIKNVSNDSEIEYIKNNNHIAIIRHSLWMQSVIQIYKLVKVGESFSFTKIFNKIKKSGEFYKLNFDEKEIEDIEKEIKKLQPTIDKVVLIREKIYVHTDRNVPDEIFENELTSIEMENLLFYIKYFIHKLIVLGTGEKIVFENNYEGSGSKMISDLTNHSLNSNKII
jgi:hypothetical protein